MKEPAEEPIIPPPALEPGARAREWARRLAEGVYPNKATLARAEGVSRAAVSQALRRWTEE